MSDLIDDIIRDEKDAAGLQIDPTKMELRQISTRHIGVLFSNWRKQSVDAMIDEAFGPFTVLVINTYCGRRGGWTREDFPREDVPCLCGQEGCYVVKYD